MTVVRDDLLLSRAQATHEVREPFDIASGLAAAGYETADPFLCEVLESHHCHLVSLANVAMPGGMTTVHVIWDLRMDRLAGNCARFTNAVMTHPTDEFLAFIESNGISYAHAVRDRQKATACYLRRVTPLLAAGISSTSTAAGTPSGPRPAPTATPVPW